MEHWEDSRYVRHIRRGPGVPRKTVIAALLAGGAVALSVATVVAHPPTVDPPGDLPPAAAMTGGEIPGVPRLLPTYGPLTPGRRPPAPTADPSTPGWSPKTPTPGPVFTVPPAAPASVMVAQGAMTVPAPTASASPSSGPPSPTPSASPVPSPTPTPHPTPSPTRHGRKHKP